MGVDLESVWKTISEDIDDLSNKLEEILKY